MRIDCGSWELRRVRIVTRKRHFPPGVEQWYFSSAVSHRGIPLFAFLLPHLEEADVLVYWDYESNQQRQSATRIRRRRSCCRCWFVRPTK